MFLRNDITPASIGFPGLWIKTAFYLTDSVYRVIQRNNDGSLVTASYSASDSQQWHFTALRGSGSDVTEFSMWVRTV